MDNITLESINGNPIPELTRVEHDFKKRHKVSASSEWYDHKRRVMSYDLCIDIKTNTGTYPFKIAAMSAGRRSDPDRLMFVRKLDVYEAAKVARDVMDHWWTGHREGIARTYDDRDNEQYVHYYIVSIFNSFRDLDNDEIIDCGFQKHYAKSLDQYKSSCSIKTDAKDGRESNMPCGCRNRCYCEPTLEYEVREYNETILISKGRQQISITLDELAGLSAFIATAKQEIKRLKLESIEAQLADLQKQKQQAESL